MRTISGMLNATRGVSFYWLPALLALLASVPHLLSVENTPSLVTTTTRSRKADPTTSLVAASETRQEWPSARTAIIVCDMWDRHWCQGASARVAEMGPVMNKTLKAARQKGVLIIHAPSDVVDFYRDTPQRRLAMEAGKTSGLKNAPSNWCPLNAAIEGKLPIDDSDGGCDCEPRCKEFKAWSRQTPLLEIRPEDAISDQGPEIFALLDQKGIDRVILMGVHINMCVLGRPFGIRQMVGQRKSVVFMRDLVDSMYNHRKAPQVSHFRGTELMVEHIERHWCPSVVSTMFTGDSPFHFQGSQP
jgi:nicotinamidase-related amidase